MSPLSRFPYVRVTRNGCCLLVYRGQGQNSRHWTKANILVDQRDWQVARRRLRWTVHVGGKS